MPAAAVDDPRGAAPRPVSRRALSFRTATAAAPFPVVVVVVLLLLVLLSSLPPPAAAEVEDGDGGSPSSSSSAADRVHSTVQYLNSNNFDDMLSDAANGFWFLKFYAPWCGHCKQMAPVLDKVAGYVEGKMAIGKVDCTVDKKLCERFNVRGYPTLKFFRDGDFHDYPGGRDADSIIDFAEKMSVEAVVPVSSYEEALEKVASTNREGVGFVAYDPAAGGGGEGGDKDAAATERLLLSTDLLQVFRQVSRKMQASASFGVILPGVGEDVLAKFGAGGGGEGEEQRPFVVKIEDGVESVTFAGETTSPDVSKFVEANNVALVTRLGPHNFRSTGNRGRPLAIGAVDYDDTAKTDALIEEITKYAKTGGPADVRDKFRYCHMDGKKWSSFLKQFEVDSENLPEFFVLDVPEKKYWRDDGGEEGEARTFGIGNIGGFLDAVASGSIEAREQDTTAGLGFLQRFHVTFVKWLPWSVFLMMGFFMAVLYGLTLIFIPDDGEIAELQHDWEKRKEGQKAESEKEDSQKEESQQEKSQKEEKEESKKLK